MITRRSLLGGILSCAAAPAIVRAEILMPVRKIIVPEIVPLLGYRTSDELERLMRYAQKLIDETCGMTPAMKTWGDNLHGGDEYREFQRLRNIQMRRLLDNIHTANSPLNLVDRQRWVTP